jgi:hypothetical protein
MNNNQILLTVVSCVVFVGLVCIAIVWYVRRRRMSHTPNIDTMKPYGATYMEDDTDELANAMSNLDVDDSKRARGGNTSMTIKMPW